MKGDLRSVSAEMPLLHFYRCFPWKQHWLLLGPLLVLVLAIGFLHGFWGEAPRQWFETLRLSFPAAKPLMRMLSDYTTPAMYCGYFALFVQSLLNGDKPKKHFVMRFVLGALAFALLAHALKAGFGLPRPGHTLPPHPFSFLHGYSSFPSGHTVAAIAAAIPLALWIGKVQYHLLFAILIAGVGLSRLWLGEHHPVDILGSIVVGTVAARFIYSGSKRDYDENRK